MDGQWLLCDFHIHTHFSDGSLSLKKVVDLYGNHAFDAISITDHILDQHSYEQCLKDDFGNALQSGASSLRETLLGEWEFADLARKDARSFLACFIDIILRSRFNTYSTNPDLFTQDIDRLIYLKRLYFEREIVLTTPNLYN
jgi:hypothetical protein